MISYPGEAKTDARDAFIIADAARAMRRSSRPRRTPRRRRAHGGPGAPESPASGGRGRERLADGHQGESLALRATRRRASPPTARSAQIVLRGDGE
nr:transposase [Streptomyces sp. SLBN-115]